MEFEFLIDNKPCKISLEKKENHFVVSDGKKTYQADIHYVTPHIISVLIDQASYQIYVARDKDKRYFSVNGHHFTVQEPSDVNEAHQSRGERPLEEMLMVKAPMPGKVIKIDVSENDPVRKNQTLAIVEAMKMENEIKSPVNGSVKKIFVSTGDLVDSEKPLIELTNNE